MIVDYNSNGWKIITQRTHGLLAGKICARWKLSDQPEKWVDTLIATTEHDDIYNEFERDPLIDHNGAPINFKATGFDLDASTRLIDMALTKSRFVALLLSRHIAFTHGDDPLSQNFIAKLKRQENIWLKEAGVTKKDLDSAYELLEFCDAFSLLICQNQIPPESRRIEISSGPDGTAYILYQKGNAIVVEPWPFSVTQFTMNYETRTIPQLKFTTNNDFRSKLKKAAIETISITISKL